MKEMSVQRIQTEVSLSPRDHGGNRGVASSSLCSCPLKGAGRKEEILYSAG